MNPAQTDFARTNRAQMTSAAPRDSAGAARLAFAASAATLVLLGALHVLSPEFAPSWRMVSEYANGQYGLVLSLMFACWAVGSWALAYGLMPQVIGRGGKIGLVFLVAAGLGEAMASVFDIKHSLHGVSALIGIPSLTIAAMLISISLGRTAGWAAARKALLWTANLTWISLILMAAAFAVLIITYRQAGGDMAAGTEITALPEGVIALVGWANRFLVIAYCAWVMTTAWYLTLMRNPQS